MRLIDVDALIKALIRKEPFSDCARVVIAECIEEVRHAPTIEERKTGKWIAHRCDKGHHIADCEFCGETIQWYDGDKTPKFCCMCGARLEAWDEQV